MLVERLAGRLRASIPNRTERMFYVFLEQVFPNANISYESTAFSAIIDGREKTTIPDFKVVRPDDKTIFIEITRDRRNGTDPKEIDRRIMKEAAPDSIYVVLYGGNLKKIQTKYEGYNFFKNEKKGKKRRMSYSDKGGHLARAIAQKAQKEAGRAGIIFSCKPTVHLDCSKHIKKRRIDRGGKRYK